MTAIPIRRQSAHYIAEFTAIAKRRGTLRVLAVEPDGTAGAVVLPLSEINLRSATARTKYVAALPDDARVEGGALLADLANDWHEQEQRAPATDPDVERESKRWPPSVPHADPQDGARLLADLDCHFTRHLVLSPGVAAVLALWVVHSWCIDAAEFTPYLWVRSPTPECGKSTLMDWLRALVYKPLGTNNASPAIMYRLIEKLRCTLLLDDIDTFMKGEKRDDIANILNSGFHRGSPVWRMEKDADGKFTEVQFATFSAKALGGIGRRVLDDSTASRTLRIDMRKASPHQLRSLPRLRSSEMEALAAPLRSRIARWRDDHINALRSHRADIPKSLPGRLSDMADPLLAIADLAGGDWPKRARDLLPLFMGRAVESTDYKVVLLMDLEAMYAERSKEFLFSAEIVVGLKALEDRPWLDWHHGKGLSTKSLADLLGEFDIKSVEMRSEGNRRGYYRTEVTTALASYLPAPSSPSAPSATELSANDLGGSGSQPASAPDPLPPNSIAATEVADGAHGEDGNPTLELPLGAPWRVTVRVS